MTDYDAVVVGAGNAGLTAAATLQQGGLRTLLVERHNVPGGAGTSFRRGRFEFESALHQLSGVGVIDHPGPLFRVLQSLGVADDLEFVREPDLYRAVVPGSHDVTIPADWAGAIDALDDAFPGNRNRLERYFDLVRRVTFWQITAMRGTPPADIDPVLFTHGPRTLGDVLDEHFTGAGIKSALAAYWPYLGVPPSHLAFQDYALTFSTYIEFKAAHIHGGSRAMSSAILDAFLRAGGDVQFSTEVTGIRTHASGVVGVRFDDGTEVGTGEVVSNASLPDTYGMLDDPPAGVSAELARRRVGPSAFVVHLGLDATATELGFTSGTNVVSTTLDDDALARNWNSLEPALGVFATCHDVAPDVAPPGFAPPGTCRLSLFTLQYSGLWDRIAPKHYHINKFGHAESLLDAIAPISPNLRDAIEEADVSTPHTLARRLGHTGGALYGYRQDPAENRLFNDRERHTGVRGLHIAGSWAGSGGFEPALESGVRVARRVVCSRAA